MTVMIVMAMMIVMSDCGTAHSRSDQNTIFLTAINHGITDM